VSQILLLYHFHSFERYHCAVLFHCFCLKASTLVFVSPVARTGKKLQPN
jgi:hypothetical protein